MTFRKSVSSTVRISVAPTLVVGYGSDGGTEFYAKPVLLETQQLVSTLSGALSLSGFIGLLIFDLKGQ